MIKTGTFSNNKKVHMDVSASPLSFEEFSVSYSERFGKIDHIRDTRVFKNLGEFQQFLKTIKGGNVVHNSCADNYNTLCIHYSDDRGDHAVALYGYKVVY